MQIDRDGFRLNVGIVLINEHRQLFWGQRVQKDSWQFPQGGMEDGESEIDAMYRELNEEIGLNKSDVSVLTKSKQLISYLLPEQFIRKHSSPQVIGQKQRWFLLKLISDEVNINLKRVSEPEFMNWVWIDFWHPVDNVIYFKKEVYKKNLQEFDSFLKSYDEGK